MTYINLCDHPIHELVSGLHLPASTEPVHTVHKTQSFLRDRVQFVKPIIASLDRPIPDPQPDTIYIVPALVLSTISGRDDIVAPHRVVRNKQGEVIGCRGFRLSDK